MGSVCGLLRKVGNYPHTDIKGGIHFIFFSARLVLWYVIHVPYRLIIW